MPLQSKKAWQAIVIGGSAGSSQVLEQLLPSLPADFAVPLVVCVHLHPADDGYFAERLNGCCLLDVVEVCDKERMRPGVVYVGPANYHLLLERQGSFALSIDERVNGSKPSIDVFFESAAVAFGPSLVGILLSGMNDDGASGLHTIRSAGGLTIVQDPTTAEHPAMPQAAIDWGAASKVSCLDDIKELVIGIVG